VANCFPSCLLPSAYFLLSLLRTLAIVARRTGPKSLLIFAGRNEGTHQRLLFWYVSYSREIDLTLPKQEADHIRVTSQVTEVQGERKLPVVFGVDESMIVYRIVQRIIECQAIHHLRTPRVAAPRVVELVDERLPFRSQIHVIGGLDVREHGVHKQRSCIQSGAILVCKFRSAY